MGLEDLNKKNRGPPGERRAQKLAAAVPNWGRCRSTPKTSTGFFSLSIPKTHPAFLSLSLSLSLSLPQLSLSLSTHATN